MGRDLKKKRKNRRVCVCVSIRKRGRVGNKEK